MVLNEIFETRAEFFPSWNEIATRRSWWKSIAVRYHVRPVLWSIKLPCAGDFVGINDLTRKTAGDSEYFVPRQNIYYISSW